MPVGTIALVIVAVIVYFGLAQRILDRMKLSDKATLAVIAAVIVGSLFNIRITPSPGGLSINVGGGLIPFAFAVWLLVTADEAAERKRGVVAAALAAAAIYAVSKLLPAGPEAVHFVDPTYVFAILAGAVAYLAGRSRRAALAAGILGIITADVIHYIEVLSRGMRADTWIGGAGAFDAVIISGLLAAGLAELVGETRERLARSTGSASGERGGSRPEKMAEALGAGEEPVHEEGGQKQDPCVQNPEEEGQERASEGSDQ